MIVLWHGAQRWEGPPRIVASRKGQVEHGPGLYLTTSAQTARKYAKGGGVVMRFELPDDIRWLEHARIPAPALIDFVNGLERLKNKKAIVADILDAWKRARDAGRGDAVHASLLVNLVYNHGALAGDKGPEIAAFYVRHGIDADRVSKGSEDWVVLFNIEKIVKWSRVPAGEASDSPRLARSAGRW